MTGRQEIDAVTRPDDVHAATRKRVRTLVVDPPWPVNISAGARRAGASSGSTRVYAARPAPYETMPVDEIAAIPVGEWASDDAALFMWTVDAMVLDGSAKRLAEAWGFEAGRLMVWEKANPGQGTFPIVAHELILVCKRGEHEWNPEYRATSVQHWKQVYRDGKKVHSAKPDGMLDMVEQASPGPYLEVFARDKARFGWQTWGDEALHGTEIVA